MHVEQQIFWHQKIWSVMHLLGKLYHNFKSSASPLAGGFLTRLVIGGVWLFVSRYLSFSLVFSRF
jgi:hypothetical protein